MPDDCLGKHLFLSRIQHPESNLWLENIVNLGESTLSHVIRTMASSAGLVGDFTNKSGRVATITRMRIANVSEYVIAANSGFKCDVRENVTNRSAVILCETLESDGRSREFNAEVNFNERAQDS